jgi:hypothetical protein
MFGAKRSAAAASVITLFKKVEKCRKGEEYRSECGLQEEKKKGLQKNI